MGWNAAVEREGISFAHPSRFILVGTMNPEEGDLRPQLLDRFGLCVDITGLQDVDERVRIMERDLWRQQDAAGLDREFEASEEHLREVIVEAKRLLPGVEVTATINWFIALVCIDEAGHARPPRGHRGARRGAHRSSRTRSGAAVSACGAAGGSREQLDPPGTSGRDHRRRHHWPPSWRWPARRRRSRQDGVAQSAGATR